MAFLSAFKKSNTVKTEWVIGDFSSNNCVVMSCCFYFNFEKSDSTETPQGSSRKLWKITFSCRQFCRKKHTCWNKRFSARLTQTLRLISKLSWSDIGAHVQLQVSFRYGQIDALLRKMTSLSSNLIGQILLCFLYWPITYLYVSQMEIIFRLSYNNYLCLIWHCLLRLFAQPFLRRWPPFQNLKAIVT